MVLLDVGEGSKGAIGIWPKRDFGSDIYPEMEMFIGKGVKDLMRYAWLGCTMIYLCFGKGF